MFTAEIKAIDLVLDAITESDNDHSSFFLTHLSTLYLKIKIESENIIHCHL